MTLKFLPVLWVYTEVNYMYNKIEKVELPKCPTPPMPYVYPDSPTGMCYRGESDGFPYYYDVNKEGDNNE